MSSIPTLGQRINTATRPLHTHLNALILSLLPLALPPHASDPQLYTTGVAHILPIYEAFENEFRSLLAWLEKAGTGLNLYGDQRAERKQDEELHLDGRRRRVILALKKLHTPELERTSRLRHDISKLQQLHGSSPKIPSPPHLTFLTNHIRTHLHSSPHLLFAYTWIFYMALFSGGRYIRFQLRQAGRPFFHPTTYEKAHDDIDSVLSFWTFPGDEDGKDLKAEFKRRFTEMGGHLTEKEREKVVREGLFVMETMVRIVEEIAAMVGTRRATEGVEAVGIGEGSWKIEVNDNGIRSWESEEPSMQWLLIKHILPLGMVELVSGAVKAFGLLCTTAPRDGTA